VLLLSGIIPIRRAPRLSVTVPKPSALARSALGWGRRIARTLLDIEVVDRSMALAGQAFAAMLPLLILLGALGHTDGRDSVDSLIRRLKLSGDSATTLRHAVAPTTEVRGGTTLLGAALLIVAALAFTRALQRLYARVWGLKSPGWRGTGWGLLWLLAFSAFWSLQPLIADVADGTTATAISLAASACLWLVTPWLLLGRRVPWHRLLPQAVLTALGLSLLGIGAAYYVPAEMASSGRQFGFIGVAFVLLSWLFAVAAVVVVSAVVGAALVERGPRPAE
jgi:membrane protein